MSTHIAEAAPQPSSYGSPDRLIPINDAAALLGRSPWTLKRMYHDGDLPVTIQRRRWFVPESFIDALFASMRPGHAADISQVARDWFAANATQAEPVKP